MNSTTIIWLRKLWMFIIYMNTCCNDHIMLKRTNRRRVKRKNEQIDNNHTLHTSHGNHMLQRRTHQRAMQTQHLRYFMNKEKRKKQRRCDFCRIIRPRRSAFSDLLYRNIGDYSAYRIGNHVHLRIKFRKGSSQRKERDHRFARRIAYRRFIVCHHQISAIYR